LIALIAIVDQQFFVAAIFRKDKGPVSDYPGINFYFMSPSWSRDSIFAGGFFGKICRKSTRQRECLLPEVDLKEDDLAFAKTVQQPLYHPSKVIIALNVQVISKF